MAERKRVGRGKPAGRKELPSEALEKDDKSTASVAQNWDCAGKLKAAVNLSVDTKKVLLWDRCWAAGVAPFNYV